MATRALLFWFLSISIFSECAFADVPHPSTPNEKEVAALVTQLSYGMSEEDAVRFLERNGLKKSVASGDSFGWCDSFDWADGRPTNLMLQIEPPFKQCGDWVNGHLKEAVFFYPDGKQVSIPLKDARKN